MTDARLHVMTVLGARPQFIKASVVSATLRAVRGVCETIVHTGQHYDEAMSQRFFDELEIPAPDRHLGVGSGSHGEQTGRMLEALDGVIAEVRPHWVLVYGDTNSTLAGALAAAKLQVPVAHVEAGLRSWNRDMPEEINRVVTDHLAALLFAPTVAAVENLGAEGVPSDRVSLIGDVMFDAALRFGDRAERDSRVLERNHLKSGGYVLATFHRPSNVDDAACLGGIIEALLTAAASVPVVLPVHPRTVPVLDSLELPVTERKRLLRLPPQGYLDMTKLVRHSRLVVTDSGGLQKEAFFHGVPCVTVRDETEWVELVELGWNRLAPPVAPEEIRLTIAAALAEPNPPRPAQMPYGDGNAAKHIVERLLAER